VRAAARRQRARPLELRVFIVLEVVLERVRRLLRLLVFSVPNEKSRVFFPNVRHVPLSCFSPTLPSPPPRF
jgi:hypothetical protein